MAYRDAFQRMMGFEGLIAGIVFVLVGIAVALALLLSRKRSGDTRRRSSHPLVETGCAVVLAAVAGAIAFVTASANDDLRADVAPEADSAPPAAQVDVDAFQWCWRFHYISPDRTVTGSCGAQNSDLPTLVVPAGQPVRLRIASSDVQHSFWIPDLRVKVDAFPDHTNTVTLNFDQEGRFLGRCAEFCGSHHTEMHFYIRVVSPQQYQQWQAGAAV